MQTRYKFSIVSLDEEEELLILEVLFRSPHCLLLRVNSDVMSPQQLNQWHWLVEFLGRRDWDWTGRSGDHPGEYVLEEIMKLWVDSNILVKCAESAASKHAGTFIELWFLNAERREVERIFLLKTFVFLFGLFQVGFLHVRPFVELISPSVY